MGGTAVRRSKIYGSRVEMKSQFVGVCRVCQGKVYKGDTIFFFPQTRKAEHYNCARRRGTVTGR